MSTAARRQADKLRARAWRRANPEAARAIANRYRARHPLTPEERERKAQINRAWHVKNAAKLKRTKAALWVASKSATNAKRRAKYAAERERHAARNAEWRAAHPGHSRAFYHRHREKFTGDGAWSNRTKKRRRAWHKFVVTCAANREAVA